ncbi:MAG: response regulator [Candidatus Eremiobacterota bacterium]
MSIRVLVLEDDETLRAVLSDVLQEHGYEVHAAPSGEAALKLARDSSFDLMVADIRMEGMDGLQALEAVREQQPTVRSLVVTGYSTEADYNRALRLGVGDYLKKPFSLGAFLSSVTRLRSEQVREREAAARETAMREAAVWAMEAMAQTAQLPDLVERARLGARLATEVGLPSPACTDVQVALLLAGMERAGHRPPDFLTHGLSQQAALLLRHLLDKGGPDPELGVVSHVAAAALSDAPPPGLDELVTEALGRVRGAPARRDGVRSGLVSLGQTMEQAGDLASAAQAYQEAVRDAGYSTERVQGLLGLARLAVARTDSAAAREHAREAVAAARMVGPTATAATSLEAAELLRRLDPGQAAELAGQARDLFEKTRNAGGLRRAELLLRCLADPPDLAALEDLFGQLLAPDEIAELSGACPWLIPWVFDRVGESPAPFLGRAARLLARQFPREVCTATSLGALSLSGRRAAAELLHDCPGPWIEEALNELRRDPDEGVRRLAEAPPASEPKGLPLLRLLSFGNFEVYRGEARVDDRAWKSQKVRYLLAFLASYKGRPVTDDVVIEAFWPEEDSRGRSNLYASISYLKSHLALPDQKGDQSYLSRARGSTALNTEVPRWHDLEEFEQHFAAGRSLQSQGQVERAMEHYRKMDRLYRGPYLVSCYMDWAGPLRTALEQKLLQALESLAGTAAQSDRPAEACEHALRITSLDPCHQNAYALLLQSCIALGRPEEAVRHFESCARVLKSELDLEPSTELLRLYHTARLAM